LGGRVNDPQNGLFLLLPRYPLMAFFLINLELKQFGAVGKDFGGPLFSRVKFR
jgi:hypothetical protein